ncbi:MAG: 50S ribosomal protein L10 [Clostridia bacterium]|nr:50S ribosomal protein L10 [Clostridia bacterium]
MNENLRNKTETVSEIVDRLNRAKSVVFSSYQGTNVADDTALRVAMRKEGNDYKVYKNRLLIRALKEVGIEGCDDYLQGTTSVAFGYNDEVSPARIIATSMKTNKQLAFKFGIVNGKVVNTEEITTISQLPSKEVLVAKLLSVLNGPATGLCVALKAITEKEN